MFPLGYDVTGVEKVISSISEGTVLILVPEDLDERAKASLDSLSAFVSGMNARGSKLNLDQMRVAFNPERDIAGLLKKLSGFDYARFYYTGGMRYLSILLYYAASVFGKEMSVLLESNSSIVAFPAVPFKGIKPVHVRLLKSLLSGPASLKKLSDDIGRSRSTTSRALGELLRIKAVSKNEKGYEITELGSAILKLAEGANA